MLVSESVTYDMLLKMMKYDHDDAYGEAESDYWLRACLSFCENE